MPIGKPLTPGRRPEVFEFRGINFAPNVCFESTVTHLLSRHLRELSERQQEPDALVNVTNDGWFFGSNCLDLHLACNVFRSVEFRKPTLIAANTGFSGHINSLGQRLDVGPRRETDILIIDFDKEARLTSQYRAVGEYPAIICLCIATLALIWGVAADRLGKRSQS